MHASLATAALVAALVISARGAVTVSPALTALYNANRAACDFFVASEGGSDSGSGTTWKRPFATVKCATDPNCNGAVNVSE